MKIIKRTITVISICMCVIFYTNSNIFVSAVEINQANSFPEGYYKLKDLNLLPNIKYNVNNESNTNDMLIVVLDNNNKVSQSARLRAKEIIILTKPLQYDYSWGWKIKFLCLNL